MSAEFISILGNTKGLKVRDRRSSFTFKEKDATIEEIGTALKVNYIIDGSVRKYGDKLKVDVQIIDVSDGSNIWSESFEYTMDNIFKMQDDIAKVIVAKLKILIDSVGKGSLAHLPNKLSQVVNNQTILIGEMFWLHFGDFPTGDITMEAIKKCRIDHRLRKRRKQMTGLHQSINRLIDITDKNH